MLGPSRRVHDEGYSRGGGVTLTRGMPQCPSAPDEPPITYRPLWLSRMATTFPLFVQPLPLSLTPNAYP